MVETKAVKGSSFTAKKMTRIAILGAISVLLSVTPLGYIPINPVIQVTIMHIPVIIAAI
ncbi:MAG TPA: ECF transporter S component, partial [Clostridiaceae bacterium]|nr:ECF transporter S component [Clostridiaceae bacterium]